MKRKETTEQQSVLLAAQEREQKQEQPKMRVDRGLIHATQEGYKHEVKAGTQLIIFDELEAKTQDKVRELNVNKRELYIGIDLDGDGWELMEVLQLLQYTHSNTTDQTKENYYLGDYEKSGNAMTLWNGKDVPNGYIETTLGEITRLRTGNNKPAKQHIKTTYNMIMKYNMQRYLIRYQEYYEETKKNGKTRKGSRKVESYTMLYKAEIATDATTRTSLVKIWLSPIFYRQIATHYDLKPQDFLARVRTAYAEITKKKQDCPELPNYLLAFLNQLIDAQLYAEQTYHCRAKGTATEKGLYDKLNYSWVKTWQWKKLEDTLAVYVEVAKRIGLLEKFWKTNTTDGDEVLNFKVTKQGEWS